MKELRPAARKISCVKFDGFSCSHSKVNIYYIFLCFLKLKGLKTVCFHGCFLQDTGRHAFLNSENKKVRACQEQTRPLSVWRGGSVPRRLGHVELDDWPKSGRHTADVWRAVERGCGV